MVWDVTVVDTLAKSHVGLTSTSPGSAAEKAEELKKVKYQAIADRFVFIPVGFETFGSWGPEAHILLNEIGRKLQEQTGESRATCFLAQKISIELQRGNSCSVTGTFPISREFDEIYSVLK